MELREYQKECVSSVLSGFKEFNKQLVVIPTGGGKTIIFAHLARMVHPKRTLILAHREELIEQAVDKIYKSTGIIAEIEKAEKKASLSAQIVVASIQTMVNRSEKFPVDHFGLIVPDEAHHSISKSWQYVLNRFDGHAWVLGVTATPDRGDKKRLADYYENIPYEVNLLNLIKEKFLSPIKTQCIPIKIDLTGVKRTAGDFDSLQLGGAIAPYLSEIALKIKEHVSNRKCLAFLPLIATSEAFVDECLKLGLDATHIDGGSKDRDEILRKFQTKKSGLLSNAMLLTEGYDCPSIDCVVVLRPTDVRSLYCQMIGRGTRIHPGKEDLLLLDFLWMHEKHDILRPASLVAAHEEESNEMQKLCEAGDVNDLMDVQRDVRAEREGRLRAELQRKANKKARNIDAIEFFLSIGELENAEWEPTVPWQTESATEKQVKLIESAGIIGSTIKSKGHASLIIGKIMQRRKLKLATPKQLKYLIKYGYENPNQATMSEAGAFLDKMFGNHT